MMNSKVREVHTLSALLKQRGYDKTSKDVYYIQAALDYIDLQPVEYTIFDWLRDTEQNYPEDLKR